MAVSCATDTPPCLQMTPSVNVVYTDVWTDPAQATPGQPITYAYTDSTYRSRRSPTTALCADRLVGELPHRHQLPRAPSSRSGTRVRPDPVNGDVSRTCTQAGCHSPTSAAGAAQTPAAQSRSDQQPVSNTSRRSSLSYVQLLFPHNTVIMGQPGPSVGPFLNAGSANGGQSAQFFSLFAAGGQHPGWLNPAELRLLSEWLDIGAQYFNNPFDPKVPVN